MKILAIDIGTGTQDILLFDTRLDVENSYKLILPSPTLMVNRKLRQATHDHADVLLTGGLMGGGPSNWAASDHQKAGNRVYASPEAARSFNDDLDAVRASGIIVVSDDEIIHLPGNVRTVEMRDFDYPAVRKVFTNFGVDMTHLGAVIVAVFDHGNAPADVSDRKFRFDYLGSRISTSDRLSTFAFPASQIPSIMTRLQSVAHDGKDVPAPLVVMDSAPAAILGALYDPSAGKHERKLMLNIGNMHTLCFRMSGEHIEGVFEHHTGFLDRSKLEALLVSFAEGHLTNEDVFNHKGHGALIRSAEPLLLDNEDFNVMVTGPRRSMIQGSSLKPCFAVPYGDMMTAGCIGLIAAVADILPDTREEIERALRNQNKDTVSPWDVEI